MAERESTPTDNRIRNRTVDSPGVISTKAVLRQVRRISRLSTGRLPLLSAVQRRWARAGDALPRGSSALPYVRPVVSARPATEGEHASDTSRPVSALRVVQPAADRTKAERPRAPGPVLRVGRMPVAASSDMGTGIVQRYVDGPAGRAARREIAPIAVQFAAGPPRVVVQAQAQGVQGSGVSQSVAAGHVTAPATRGNDRETAIVPGILVRRQSNRPPGELSSPQAGPAAPVISAKGDPVVARALPLADPRGQPPTESSAAPPSDTGAQEPITVRQTPVSSPSTGRVERAAQSPIGTLPFPTGQTIRRQTRTTPPLSRKAETTTGSEHPAPRVNAEQPARSSDRETVIARRALVQQPPGAWPTVSTRPLGDKSGAPSQPIVSRQPTGTGEPGLVLPQRSPPGQPPEPGLTGVVDRQPSDTAPSSRTRAQVPSHALRAPREPPLARASRTIVPGITRKVELPLFRTPPGHDGTSGKRERGVVWPELPLARALERGVVRTSADGALPNISANVVLRRAVGESPSVSQIAAQSAAPGDTAEGSLPPPMEAPAADESPTITGPALERLADEVYTIIERRLILERERRGY